MEFSQLTAEVGSRLCHLPSRTVFFSAAHVAISEIRLSECSKMFYGVFLCVCGMRADKGSNCKT